MTGYFGCAKVIGVYSQPRLILYLSFVEICLLVFPDDKPTNQPDAVLKKLFSLSI